MTEKNDDLVSTFVEVNLKDPSKFLKVKETLTRIGIASHKEKKLWQSCHILHKQGKYYIVHFKELFSLDGKKVDYTTEDKARRNTIAALLEDWDLVDIVKPELVDDQMSLRTIKIIPFKEKGDWELIEKYNCGKKSKKQLLIDSPVERQ